jgi:PAS domain S-box-containing protein
MVEREPAGHPPKPSRLDEVAGEVRELLASTEELDQSDSEMCATIRGDLRTLLDRFSPSTADASTKNLDHSYTEEMMHSMIEAVVVARQDGTIHSLNDAAQKLLDYEGLEVIGKPLSVLTDNLEETPEETQERGKILGKLFSVGSLQNLAVRAKSKDGLTIPMSVNATLLRAEDSQLLGILLVARDTRENRRLTQEARGAVQAEAARTKQLEAAYEALDRAHQDLTNTQSQLIQAGRLAAVGELGAGIAHELNQPLTTIQGFAQRMRNHPNETIEKYIDELDLIIHGADRMARIVNNIRRFARQEEFDPKPIDPFAPCRAALQLVNEQLRLHSIELEIPEVVFLPLVMGDTIQLEQVFLNLLTNARDALDHNPPDKKRVLSIESDIEPTYAIVRVTDNGPGIAPGVTSKIFDPFFTTKPPGQGTGLGLSIVHGIMRDHGGQISYKPNPDGGCIFEVRLPVAPPDAPKEPRENT